MGGVPVKHHSKSKVGRRRSQLSLKPKTVTKCPNCGSSTLPHRACPNCDFYPSKSSKKEKVAS
jgi:large subunit ribosomal protein L32